jgi:hypothetical protein
MVVLEPVEPVLQLYQMPRITEYSRQMEHQILLMQKQI